MKKYKYTVTAKNNNKNGMRCCISAPMCFDNAIEFAEKLNLEIKRADIHYLSAVEIVQSITKE